MLASSSAICFSSTAVVVDGKTILSNVISSQNEFHAKYGGIVPEIASRKHVELILYVIQDALDSAGEWFYDSSTSTLYLWAPGDGNPEGRVEAKRRNHAFDLSNRSHIKIEGFNIFASSIVTNPDSHHIVMDVLNAKYVEHYTIIERKN